MATKFRRGKCINSLRELLDLIEAGKWVYMYNRPRHPKFVSNIQVKKLSAMIRVGNFFEAIEKDGRRGDPSMHHSPQPHKPHWLLDSGNFGTCQFPGCNETKQWPTRAEVEDNLAKHRNYRDKLEGGLND